MKEIWLDVKPGFGPGPLCGGDQLTMHGDGGSACHRPGGGGSGWGPGPGCGITGGI